MNLKFLSYFNTMKKSLGRAKGTSKKIINITDPLIAPYFIQKDEYSFTVMHGTSFCGSYATLESALKKIIDFKLLDELQLVTLSEYILKYKELQEKITNIFK